MKTGLTSSIVPNGKIKLNNNIEGNCKFIKIQKNREIKLKWFQIRLVHSILGTNIVLRKMGIEKDDKCTFCKQERDSLDHIFWKCVHADLFLKQLQDNINDVYGNAVSMNLSETFVVFGGDGNLKSDSVLILLCCLQISLFTNGKWKRKYHYIYTF